MKRILLLIILSAAALYSHAQTKDMETADAYFAKKSYANAAGYYNRVLTVDSANFKALRRMGYCVMNMPENELNALGYFYKALNQQPNDPISNYYMGVVFMDEAKRQTDISAKNDFKAKAAMYLNKAVTYGSEDAKDAVKDLNAI